MQEILDFSIYSDADREAFIEAHLAQLGRNPTQKELDLFANYILFGKGRDGLSDVDRGLISIPTKYNSYRRKGDKLLSLDELRENPAFDERELKPLQKGIYKAARQQLKRDDPELEPLRREIGRLQHIYDVNIGKAPPDPAVKALTQTQLYHLNHQLISLKSQQYLVKEGTSPSLGVRAHENAYAHPYEPPLEFWPMGAYFGTERARFEDPRHTPNTYHPTYGDLNALEFPDRLIDFTNPDTVRELIDHYELLTEAALDSPMGDAAQLIATLDWYESQAHLAPSRHDLYMYKKARWPNRATRDRINRDYAKKYNENYISTIYTRDVCGGIAAAAKLHYLQWRERLNPSAWKKCSKCGKWHLKAHEFRARTSSSDGYSAQCIWCEADKRNGKKRPTRPAFLLSLDRGEVKIRGTQTQEGKKED